MTSPKKILRSILLAAILGACIEPYDPPAGADDLNLLVVDSFLDASQGMLRVMLTRTLPVKSPEMIPRVSGATVLLEDEQGTLYPVAETGEGMYAADAVDIDFQTRYRLVIRTDENHEYASEFVELTHAPPIDSISYYRRNDAVEFAVHTHDPTGMARYFRWQYEETYEYNSDHNSALMFEGDQVVTRPPELSTYTCWRSNLSTNILIGTTKHLTESRVNRAPITRVPSGSLKISVTYSLLVKQQVLTEDAYNYWRNLERSTENLGGLFDPLPSEVKGNFFSTTHPKEKVIGFFTGGTVQDSRIFVERWELPRGITGYSGINSSCLLDTLLLSDIPTADKEFTFLVSEIIAPGVGLLGYFTTFQFCVDCRNKGGTTTKPEFWN